MYLLRQYVLCTTITCKETAVCTYSDSTYYVRQSPARRQQCVLTQTVRTMYDNHLQGDSSVYLLRQYVLCTTITCKETAVCTYSDSTYYVRQSPARRQQCVLTQTVRTMYDNIVTHLRLVAVMCGVCCCQISRSSYSVSR